MSLVPHARFRSAASVAPVVQVEGLECVICHAQALDWRACLDGEVLRPLHVESRLRLVTRGAGP
jgi:hypothetical protein